MTLWTIIGEIMQELPCYGIVRRAVSLLTQLQLSLTHFTHLKDKEGGIKNKDIQIIQIGSHLNKKQSEHSCISEEGGAAKNMIENQEDRRAHHT